MTFSVSERFFKIFCIHRLQKHLPCTKLLLAALCQRHLTSVPFLLQKTVSAQRERVSGYQVKIVECLEKSSRVACRKKGTNRTHDLLSSSFKWYSLTGSLRFPAFATFPLFAVILPPPKYSWITGNANGKRRSYNAVLLKFPESLS